MIVAGEVREQYELRGYIGPVRVLSELDCRGFLGATRDQRSGPPVDWFKGHAASSRAFYEIGMHPAIVEVVSAFLGDDVILWGAAVETRPPGAIHPWHSDIESSASCGNAVSVWIGLEHTGRDSSLLLMPYSHRFGVTVQEIRHRQGKGRDEATDDDVERWARERDPRSRVTRPTVADGEALFFDGRLWHGSHNVSPDVRHALLLQYATADLEIWIPDLNQLDWPFRRLDSPRPPCVMVKGSAKVDVNRVVPAPAAANRTPVPLLTNRVHSLRLPLPPDEKKSWKPYPLFHGSTAGLQSLSCHVSVLHSNHSPHPPHRHPEEEILLLLAGRVDLELPDLPALGADPRRCLEPGEFVYYPAGFAHTLVTTSEEPANYLMLKWNDGGNPAGADSPLPFGHFKLFDPAEDAVSGQGFCPRFVFEGPTRYLQKLHCHSSTLTRGAGYEPHIDAHDVAIVVLEGEVETLGERVGPNSVIFCPAGEPHGMRNPGGAIAKYVVFEFHGRPFWADPSE